MMEIVLFRDYTCSEPGGDSVNILNGTPVGQGIQEITMGKVKDRWRKVIKKGHMDYLLQYPPCLFRISRYGKEKTSCNLKIELAYERCIFPLTKGRRIRKGNACLSDMAHPEKAITIGSSMEQSQGIGVGLLRPV